MLTIAISSCYGEVIQNSREMLNIAFNCQKQHQDDESRLAEAKILWLKLKTNKYNLTLANKII